MIENIFSTICLIGAICGGIWYIKTIRDVNKTTDELYDQLSIVWSENPGCFERHLQRKFNNPLFSPKNRKVSKHEIDTARQKDIKDTEDLQQEIEKLYNDFKQKKLELNLTVGEAGDLREKIDNLTCRTLTVDGGALAFMPLLFELRTTIIDDWRVYLLTNGKEDLIKVLDEAERLFAAEDILKTPFVLQFMRKDSPICRLDIDIVPSVLSEEIKTIEVFCRYIISSKPDKKIISFFKKETSKVIKAMWKRGEMLTPENLAILQEKINLMEVIWSNEVCYENKQKQEIKQTKTTQEKITRELIEKIRSAGIAEKFESSGVGSLPLDHPLVPMLNSLNNVIDIIEYFNLKPKAFAYLLDITNKSIVYGAEELQHMSQIVKQKKDGASLYEDPFDKPYNDYSDNPYSSLTNPFEIGSGQYDGYEGFLKCNIFDDSVTSLCDGKSDSFKEGFQECHRRACKEIAYNNSREDELFK